MGTRDNYKGGNYADMTPFRAVHPGEVLWEEMKERRISKNALAEQLGMPRAMLSDLLKGKRDFTPDFAVKLQELLGIDAESWMNLQAGYWRNVKRIAEREAHQAATTAKTTAEPIIEYAV
jgi:addiction module antidote protein HigA